MGNGCKHPIPEKNKKGKEVEKNKSKNCTYNDLFMFYLKVKSVKLQF